MVGVKMPLSAARGVFCAQRASRSGRWLAGHHVLAARPSVAAGKHGGAAFRDSGARGGLLSSLFTLLPFLLYLKVLLGDASKSADRRRVDGFMPTQIQSFTSVPRLVSSVQVHMADVRSMPYTCARR